MTCKDRVCANEGQTPRGPFLLAGPQRKSEGRKESHMVDVRAYDFEHASNLDSFFPSLSVQSEHLTETHCNQAIQTNLSLLTL